MHPISRQSLLDLVVRLEQADELISTESILRNAIQQKRAQVMDALADLKAMLDNLVPADRIRVEHHPRLARVLKKWSPFIGDLLASIHPEWEYLLSDETLQKLDEMLEAKRRLEETGLCVLTLGDADAESIEQICREFGGKLVPVPRDWVGGRLRSFFEFPDKETTRQAGNKVKQRYTQVEVRIGNPSDLDGNWELLR